MTAFAPDLPPVTTTEVAAIEAAELAHRRTLRYLPAGHETQCESCEEASAVAAMSWVETDGTEHEPNLCTGCIARDFLDLRLVRALIEAEGQRDALGEELTQTELREQQQRVRAEMAEAAVVEARKAALHEAADELEALVQSAVTAHLKWPEMEPIPLPVSKWLRGRADAHCPTR